MKWPRNQDHELALIKAELARVGLVFNSLDELRGRKFSLPEQLALRRCHRYARTFFHTAWLHELLPSRPARTAEDESRMTVEFAALVEAVNESGYAIEKASDLEYSKLAGHPATVKALLELLPRVTTREAKDTIVTALQDPAARGIAEAGLIREWQATPVDYFALSYLWQVGRAIGMCGTQTSAGWIRKTLLDAQYSYARQELTGFMARDKSPDAAEFLAELLLDRDLTLHAIDAVGRRKDTRISARVRENLVAVTQWTDWPTAVQHAKRLLARWDRADKGTAVPPAVAKPSRLRLSPALQEYSVNMDRTDVVPALELVSGLVEQGFGRAEIDQVDALLDSLEVGKEAAVRFWVHRGGRGEELQLKFFMDDEESPDVYFLGSKDFVQRIESALHQARGTSSEGA